MKVSKRPTRRRVKRQTDIDADIYEIPKKEIPKGSSYQWIAITLNGEEDHTLKWVLEYHIKDGWKYVPFKRHAKRFAGHNSCGKIIVRGLGLFERPIKKTEAAKGLERKKARDQFIEASEQFRRRDGSPHSINIDFKPNGESYRSKPIDMSLLDGEPRDVEIPIKIRLPSRLVEMAAYLSLTPQEYARRTVVLLTRSESGILSPVYDGYGRIDGLFEIRQLKLAEK